MDELPFQKEQLDLIWSEGGIASIGFEKGLNYWKGFLKKDGYVVVTIPATKISKSTVKKFKSYWRLLAHLQTPFIPKTEIIGGAYFSICTDKRYNGATGKLINHLGQIAQVAYPSISFAKMIRGLEYCPHYADEKETSKCVWRCCQYICEMLIPA